MKTFCWEQLATAKGAISCVNVMRLSWWPHLEEWEHLQEVVDGLAAVKVRLPLTQSLGQLLGLQTTR
jgi:hypothetical protein